MNIDVADDGSSTNNRAKAQAKSKLAHIPTDNTSERYCKHCGENKPLSEWYFQTREQGYGAHCKACWNKRDRGYYAKNRAKRLEQLREYKRTPRGKEVTQRALDKHDEKHPEKNIARSRLRYAVGRGLVEKKPCEDCGDPKVEAHHYKGYAKENWYTVRWLCQKHHRDAHKFSLESKGVI